MTPLTLAEIADKADEYARVLGSADTLRFALQSLAMLVRQHVPASSQCERCGRIFALEIPSHVCSQSAPPQPGSDARIRCADGCQGIEIAPGEWSGCGCPGGQLANGQPCPVGFVCDCPQHPRRTS